MTPQAHELQLQAGGLRLAARQFGPADGRRVLALHGWMDNAASFQALAPLLTECCVTAVELPGHGLSDSGGEWFAFLDNIIVIHLARQALGWDRCVVLGHSMGGGLGAVYAAAFPDHVERLVSLDAYGPISGDDLLGQMRDALTARESGPQQRYFESRDEAVAARAHGHFPLACAEALADRGVVETAQGWTWRGDRRLKWPSLVRLTEAQVVQALRAIAVPHLLLRASRLMYPQFAERVAGRVQTVPPTRQETIEASHHLHMEQPEACAAVINEFLGPADA